MLNRDGASAAKDFGYPEPPKVRPKDGQELLGGGEVVVEESADALPLLRVLLHLPEDDPEKAGKELQKLIDKGYMGEDAYIDYDRGYFLRFGATLEEEPVPSSSNST